MAVVAFTAFRAECDLCGCEVPGDDGEPWYLSMELALKDLEAWDWHVDGRHVCCWECNDYCTWCERRHGAHDIGCDLIDDQVEHWIAALTAEGGEA